MSASNLRTMWLDIFAVTGGKYAGIGWDRLICFLKYDFMILDRRL